MNPLPAKFGPFKLDAHKPTSMKYGTYYDAVLELPFAKKTKKRHVRVWLPEEYDPKNKKQRFPVIYFSDGQNLVDRHLSAYGDWQLDKAVHRLVKSKKGMPFIAVGIDCPKIPLERAAELCPPYAPDYEPNLKSYDPKKRYSKPYGDKYVDYIADELKPMIDKLFLTDKSNTAVGGSSMGGIMAFYAYMRRPEVFSFSLSFSPAFLLYGKRHWKEIVNELGVPKKGKIYLFTGGEELDEKILPGTYETFAQLKAMGMGVDRLRLGIDSHRIHHESAWADWLEPAFAFWFEKSEKKDKAKK